MSRYTGTDVTSWIEVALADDMLKKARTGCSVMLLSLSSTP